MTEEQKKWIEEHKLIFTSSQKLFDTDLDMLFSIYNSITGENKKKTACGRCVTNVARRVWFEYNREL